MSRRTVFVLLGVVLLLSVAAGGWSLWWLRLADGVRDGIERWAEARRADGWQVAFETVAIDGFPGIMHVRLGTVRLTRPDGLDWQAPPVSGALSPLQPQQVRVAAPGRHVLTAGGGVEPLQLDLARAEADVEVDAYGRLESAAALVEGVTAAAPGAAPVTAASVQAGLQRMAVGAAADHTVTTAAFTLAAREVELPEGAVPVMERRLGLAALSGRLQGSVPPGDLMPALGDWRDDGGTVEIDRLRLEWQPLQVTAEGTLAFDAEMQPLLAMTASIRGFFELVDALVRHEMVRPRDAQVAKLVLGLMARTPPEGGPPALQVPVTVQDRVLSVGPAALLQLPPIRWPGGLRPSPGSPPPGSAPSPPSAPH